MLDLSNVNDILIISVATICGVYWLILIFNWVSNKMTGRSKITKNDMVEKRRIGIPEVYVEELLYLGDIYATTHRKSDCYRLNKRIQDIVPEFRDESILWKIEVNKLCTKIWLVEYEEAE